MPENDIIKKDYIVGSRAVERADTSNNHTSSEFRLRTSVLHLGNTSVGKEIRSTNSALRARSVGGETKGPR
jgi:hypothetical protein